MKIKILDPRLSLPKYATEGSAAIDLRFVATLGGLCDINSVILEPGDQILIGTGVALDMDDRRDDPLIKMAALVLPRSGLGSRGIILGNTIGLIDSDYQGEIKVCLWNRGTEDFFIRPLDRIAQLMFVPYFKPTFELVNEFEPTKRGAKGWGSTGI